MLCHRIPLSNDSTRPNQTCCRLLRRRFSRSESLPRQQLLEKVDRARVVRLAEPKQSLLAYLGILVRSRYCDQRRNALVARTLRKREHRALTDFTIDTVIDDQTVEVTCRCLSCSLPQPEYRLSPGTPWQIRIARDPKERRPDVGAVGKSGGEKHLFFPSTPVRPRPPHHKSGPLPPPPPPPYHRIPPPPPAPHT